MANKFKLKKNINIIKLLLKKIWIKIKNLPKKPDKGGTPANDKKLKTIKVVIICKLWVNFKSLSDFNHLVSNKKKIKNTFNIKIM